APPPGAPAGQPAGAGSALPDARRPDGRLDLNRATVDDLEELPGIGPVLAERIVAHREQRGGFAAGGDLREVRGIGEKTFQTLAELVSV
ncbi:MAG TPA: helix-hairpin-helix domain-containing protein, partial [Egibacteraceae bacterium]|nr:helix-hairpin-helix domain-containing protein [Egibacteraceae bacterium]